MVVFWGVGVFFLLVVVLLRHKESFSSMWVSLEASDVYYFGVHKVFVGPSNFYDQHRLGGGCLFCHRPLFWHKYQSFGGIFISTLLGFWDLERVGIL